MEVTNCMGGVCIIAKHTGVSIFTHRAPYFVQPE